MRYFPDDEPKQVKTIKLKVDFDDSKQIEWRIDKTTTLKSDDIVRQIFVFIMESIQKEKEKKFRK